MTRWEYEVVPRLALVRAPKDTAQALNERSERGWELVSTVVLEGQLLYYFKRELPPPAPKVEAPPRAQEMTAFDRWQRELIANPYANAVAALSALVQETRDIKNEMNAGNPVDFVAGYQQTLAEMRERVERYLFVLEGRRR